MRFYLQWVGIEVCYRGGRLSSYKPIRNFGITPSPEKLTTMASAIAAATRETHVDLSPFIKLYKDGTFDRLIDSSYVPPNSKNPQTGVSSKDTTTNPPTPPARLFLPPITDSTQKLPILLYFHGGGFCVGSVFSLADTRFLSALSAAAKSLVIAVEYRLAPEHPLPAAYEDSWAALNWVCSHVPDQNQTQFEKDPWIINHGDLGRIFVGGDSAGANIAHNLAMRTGSEPLPGNRQISGLILNHPYFWGSNLVGSGSEEAIEQSLGYRVWAFAYPDADGGIESPMINPISDGAPSLSGLGCSKLLVSLAGKDSLTPNGAAYAENVKKSGWKGVVEVVEIEGEDHCFHIFDTAGEKARSLFGRMAAFINSE